MLIEFLVKVIQQIGHKKLYTITDLIHDTIPSFRIDYLPERCNQNLLFPTKLSLEQNNQIMKKLNLIQKIIKLQMELIQDGITQKYAKKRGRCSRNTFFHTNTNILVSQVDIT